MGYKKLKTVGLALALAVVAAAGDIPATAPGTPAARAVTVAPQICQPPRHGLHPLRAMRHLHDHFVNFAIALSSVGIDQPAENTAAEPPLNPSEQSLALASSDKGCSAQAQVVQPSL